MHDITTAFALLNACHDAPHLAKLAQSALAYYPDDPNTVLIKLRQLGEAILHNTAQHHHIEADSSDKQRDLLALLQYRELILPDDIADHLHALRRQGNRAAHDYHEDAADAAVCLQHAAAVATWHYHTCYAAEIEAKARAAEAAAAEAAAQAERAAERKERRAQARSEEAAHIARAIAQQQLRTAAQVVKAEAAAATRAARRAEKAACKAAKQAEHEQLAAARQAEAAERRRQKAERQAHKKRIADLTLLGDRHKKNKNHRAAAAAYREAAEAGGIRAMAELALLYIYGHGVEQDYAAALVWNQKAATRHNPMALTNLGLAYEKGLGVAIDGQKALHYYRRAAALGETAARHNLGSLFRKGKIVPQDLTQARQWYEKIADHNISASTWLGWFYLYGKGVPKNPRKAAFYYRIAAQAGGPAAQLSLGLIHGSGILGEKDYRTARYWLEKAAAQNDSDAHAALGDYYRYGKGVPPDLDRAIAHYRVAARLGNTAARRALDDINKKPPPGKEP